MNDKTPLQLKQLLTFTSFAGSIAMLLSIIYEVAYFKVLYGKSLYFLSLNDYLANSLEWLPVISIYVLWIFLYNFEEIFVFQSSLEERQKNAQDQLEHPLRERTHQILFQSILIIFVLAIPFLPQNNPLVFIGIAILFFIITYIFLKISNIFSWVQAGKIQPQLIIHLMFSLIILALFAVNGAFKAYIDLKQTDADISIKGAPTNIVLLRALEKGMLIRDIDNNELLLFSYDNKQIWKTELSKLSEESRICLWYGWWCKNETSDNPLQEMISK